MSNRAAIVSGDGWRAAKSLVSLYDQVKAAYPNRTKTEDDATIGDTAHAARTSDHNPNSADVVTALDLMHDPVGGFNSYAFADTLLANKDERVKYIISNSRIGYGPRSPSHGGNPASLWKWGPYTGDNPHDQHVHISVGDSRYYDKTDPWDIGGDKVPDMMGPPLLRSGAQGEAVKVLQRLLPVTVDGIFGPKTKQAVIAFQKAHGLAGDGIVGPLTWAALLAPTDTSGWHTGITATEFGGAGDPNNSAYDNHKITDSEMAVALPYRFPGVRPKVEVRGPNETAVGTIEDIGPWNINNPYWNTPGARPQAESGTDTTGRHTNLAGIDLSPAMARAVGINGKGKVDWRFYQEAMPILQAGSLEPETFAMATIAPTAVVVPVVPAVQSKTNWTQFAGIAASIITILSSGKLNIPPDTLVSIVVAIQAIQGIVTFLLKTYYTNSVTPSVAAKV